MDLLDDFAPFRADYISSLKGIPIYLGAKHVIADNNIIIVDKAMVIIGSFKFTNMQRGKTP